MRYVKNIIQHPVIFDNNESNNANTFTRADKILASYFLAQT